MHRYFFSRELLREKLPAFVGGQFLLKTKLKEREMRSLMRTGIGEKDTQSIIMTRRAEEKDSLVFRGEIQDLFIPDMERRFVVVRYKWLCEPRLVFDASFHGLVLKWVAVKPPPPPCVTEIKYEFLTFYFPKLSLGRLKMLGSLREYLRLYKPGDPENLVQDGDKFRVQTKSGQ